MVGWGGWWWWWTRGHNVTMTVTSRLLHSRSTARLDFNAPSYCLNYLKSAETISSVYASAFIGSIKHTVYGTFRSFSQEVCQEHA